MDALFWCEECGQTQVEECKVHSVTHIKDRVVPTYARLTLPHVLNIKVVEFRAVGSHVHGVFSKKLIQDRTQFGPLIAPKRDKKGSLEQRMVVKLFSYPDICGHRLDLSNEEKCNWMMFVRPARTPEEQNLIAFQHKGKIFYTTTKVIPAGNELKVWYASNYAKLMKTKLLKEMSHDDDETWNNSLAENMSDDDFEYSPVNEVQVIPPVSLPAVSQSYEIVVYDCSICGAKFADLTSLDSHMCPETTQDTEVAIQDLIIDFKDSIEDDSRSDDSPQKRNKRKGNPVKLSKSGRVIKPKFQKDSADIEDSPEKPTPRETRRRTRSKAQKAVKTKLGFQESQEKEPTVCEIESQTEEKMEVNPLVTESLAEENILIDSLAEMKTEKENNAVKERKKRRGSLHKCPICAKFFPSAMRLRSHSYIHTGERPYSCDHSGCGKAFTSLFKLNRHLLIHSARRTHSCPLCDFSFTRKDHLKNHMKVHNPDKPVHNCDKCGRVYTTSFSYRTHMAFHCADEGDLACFVCKEEFVDKDKLIHHLKIHAGAQSVKSVVKRTEKCPHCDKRFFNQKDVRRHVITHTGEKDYLCQYCPQRFGRTDHLTRHLRAVHTGSMNAESVGTSAPEVKEDVEPVELPLPPDLKSCKVEATIPPMDYQHVEQIQNLVLDSPHNENLPGSSSLDPTSQMLENAQNVLRPLSPAQSIMTAQVNPNAQYVYLRNALPPCSQQYTIPASTNITTPVSGLPLQSVTLPLHANSTQPILTKLDLKPFDNLVSTLVPMLNIHCSTLDEKLTPQELGLAVQNVTNLIHSHDPNNSILSPVSIPSHRELSLIDPSTSSRIDTEERFFAASHMNQDKVTLSIDGLGHTSEVKNAADANFYVPTCQNLDKLPDIGLGDRKLNGPGASLEDIKLSDGPCIISESQLASYLETLKVLGSMPHIPTGPGGTYASTSNALDPVLDGTSSLVSFASSLSEFSHSFQ